ncbi:MAG: glycoside hydrolase, partial [Sediminibacterium sp.]|nr:glycoside hydrolase [Sediminibacterium sp.]
MKYLLATGLFVCCLLQTLHAQLRSPNYEFRAVWVATVDNIDWPDSKFSSVAEQKAAFIRLLDIHENTGMNAVIVQVRPAADAFYPSAFEPWSEFLTGRQGLAPNPLWDPLAFMIAETHKRGMEFHAWLNPYRAVFNLRTSSVAPNHVTRTHPE